MKVDKQYMGDPDADRAVIRSIAAPLYLNELEHDPLAFTSAEGGASPPPLLPLAWDELDEVIRREAAAAITEFVLVSAGAGGTCPSIGRN